MSKASWTSHLVPMCSLWVCSCCGALVGNLRADGTPSENANSMLKDRDHPPTRELDRGQRRTVRPVLDPGPSRAYSGSAGPIVS